MEPIPQEWIKSQIDAMLDLAEKLPDRNPMREALMIRADHIMDLVRAFRERNQPKLF